MVRHFHILRVIYLQLFYSFHLYHNALKLQKKIRSTFEILPKKNTGQDLSYSSVSNIPILTQMSRYTMLEILYSLADRTANSRI